MISAAAGAALELPRDPDAVRWEPLRRLAAVTALKRTAEGGYFPGHWWRGPLLYALVQRYRPRHILEIGTGRGYGAACMAHASVDAGFECTVWTIDTIAPDTTQEWALDEGDGPTVRPLSLRTVWQRHVPAAIAARVQWLTGDSGRVVRGWRRDGRPSVQFVFIDGGHDYATVRHDFMRALEVADAGCTFVFDDYTDRPRYGVRRLIDRDVRIMLPAEAVVVMDALAWDVLPGGRRAHHHLAAVRGEYMPAAPRPVFYSGVAVGAIRMRLAASRFVRAGRTAAGRILGRRP